jgi:thioester reductase-like protein
MLSALRSTLVLGFPNVRARHLVRHLLGDPAERVIALVREQDTKHAEAFREGCRFADVARLSFLSGDPSAIDLGLDVREYNELRAQVSTIQHLAQVTDIGTDRRECETINIGSMREALELARACERLESLVVHSNVCVSGDRTGNVKEAELNAGQGFSGAVDATLAVAELMARRRMRELPIVVLRAGRVVDDTASEQSDLLDGVHLLILFMLSSPQDLASMLPPWGEVPLNVVSLSYLTRAAERLAREPGARGQTLHLTDPRPLSIRSAFARCLAIRERLNKEGFSMPALSRVIRNVQGLQGILRRPRAFISMNFRDVRYDTARASELLDPLGLSCPSLDAYMERLVRQVVEMIGAVAASSAEPRDGDVA